ncbi:MAG TPA: sigma-E factor regulatory protein RseB domain-containing protein [Bryobacteraceae bacterium]|nr:sigma-E factor regulatory protein RseB domain-containing protein [Bryobacteraceae bacterium]
MATTIGDSNSPLPSADEVVANMMVRDRERQSALNGYTAARRYILENQSHHKRAEMLVRVTCQRDGSKQFETISETGWGGARKYVFRGLLDAEIEASRPELRQRSRVTPENYAFEMMGTEYVNGRPAYVMGIAPKTPNKYLTKGRIWIDAEEYAIVRIEGKPAKNPSFWIKSVHFVHNYEKQGSFWFPVSDVSVTDARIFGNTELTVEYFTYTPTTSAPSAARESVRANLPN